MHAGVGSSGAEAESVLVLFCFRRLFFFSRFVSPQTLVSGCWSCPLVLPVGCCFGVSCLGVVVRLVCSRIRRCVVDENTLRARQTPKHTKHKPQTVNRQQRPPNPQKQPDLPRSHDQTDSSNQDNSPNRTNSNITHQRTNETQRTEDDTHSEPSKLTVGIRVFPARANMPTAVRFQRSPRHRGPLGHPRSDPESAKHPIGNSDNASWIECQKSGKFAHCGRFGVLPSQHDTHMCVLLTSSRLQPPVDVVATDRSSTAVTGGPRHEQERDWKPETHFPGHM